MSDEDEVRDPAARGMKLLEYRSMRPCSFWGNCTLPGDQRTHGQGTRAGVLQVGPRELLNALFSNPMDDNHTVKLLKLTGSVLEDVWKETEETNMEEIIQKIENVVLDAHGSRDVKQMLSKLLELGSRNWGGVPVARNT